MIHNKLEVKFVYIEETTIDNYPTQIESYIIDRAIEQNISTNRYYQAQNLNMQLSMVIKVRSFLLEKPLERVEIDNKQYKVTRSQQIGTNYHILELSDYN